MTHAPRLATTAIIIALSLAGCAASPADAPVPTPSEVPAEEGATGEGSIWVLPELDGVTAGLPEGWTEQSVGGLALGTPAGWAVFQEGLWIGAPALACGTGDGGGQVQQVQVISKPSTDWDGSWSGETDGAAYLLTVPGAQYAAGYTQSDTYNQGACTFGHYEAQLKAESGEFYKVILFAPFDDGGLTLFRQLVGTLSL